MLRQSPRPAARLRSADGIEPPAAQRPILKSFVGSGPRPSLTQKGAMVEADGIEPPGRAAANPKELRRFRTETLSDPKGRDGGGGRDRTDDLKLAKLPLSQLSYAPFVPPRALGAGKTARWAVFRRKAQDSYAGAEPRPRAAAFLSARVA